jgi:hypothetical protein
VDAVYDETGTLLEQWDDEARTYSRWDGVDPAPVEIRPYTEAENADADARATAATEAANEATLEGELDAALTELQVIIDTSNAEINENPAGEIKDIARIVKKTIRKVNERFEATE